MRTLLSNLKLPAILEVTLRDGSYAIDFRFTRKDTEIVSGLLEDAGISLIEVGHGVGLGAWRFPEWRSAEEDIEYLKAAQKALTKAKWGAFCIPGIANLNDVDIAADHGMSFIRIGTNVTEVNASEEYIRNAKRRNLFVCANFMKSYTLPPKQFVKTAVQSQEYGADLVYIVDSAGGFFPEDIESYVSELRQEIEIPIGFHGHNNLSLGIANSLKAVDMGVDIVDSSLQGLGRSSGNPPTEILVSALSKKGYEMGVDLLKLMDIGEEYIRPLITESGTSSLDVICGLAQFHSSYMGTIRRFTGMYGVDPRELIMRVCEKDRINADPEMVKKIAEDLSKESSGAPATRFRLDRYTGDEQDKKKSQ